MTCLMEGELAANKPGKVMMDTPVNVNEMGAHFADIPDPLLSHNPIKKDIPWSPDLAKNNYNSILLKHFHPSRERKVETADKTLHNPRCGMYRSATAKNIWFHQPGTADPDSQVSCYCPFPTPHIDPCLLPSVCPSRR